MRKPRGPRNARRRSSRGLSPSSWHEHHGLGGHPSPFGMARPGRRGRCRDVSLRPGAGTAPRDGPAAARRESKARIKEEGYGACGRGRRTARVCTTRTPPSRGAVSARPRTAARSRLFSRHSTPAASPVSATGGCRVSTSCRQSCRPRVPGAPASSIRSSGRRAATITGRRPARRTSAGSLLPPTQALHIDFSTVRAAQAVRKLGGVFGPRGARRSVDATSFHRTAVTASVSTCRLGSRSTDCRVLSLDENTAST